MKTIPECQELQELCRSHANQRLSTEEYRQKRKELLDKLDWQYNANHYLIHWKVNKLLTKLKGLITSS